MATTVRIHLQGGPCNGTNTTVQRTGDLLPGYTCKGTEYQPTDQVTGAGRVIYTTKASQQQPPPQVPQHHATGSWHRLMKASLHDFPHAVQRSNEHLRQIRRLSRSH